MEWEKKGRGIGSGEAKVRSEGIDRQGESVRRVWREIRVGCA